MSVLQEYEEIRKILGEERYSEICAFLKAHPQYLLSDVYYNEQVYNESVEWAKKEYGVSADKRSEKHKADKDIEF